MKIPGLFTQVFPPPVIWIAGKLWNNLYEKYTYYRPGTWICVQLKWKRWLLHIYAFLPIHLSDSCSYHVMWFCSELLHLTKVITIPMWRYIPQFLNCTCKHHWKGKTIDQTYCLRPFCTHWHNNWRRVGAFLAHNTMLWLPWDAGVYNQTENLL